MSSQIEKKERMEVLFFLKRESIQSTLTIECHHKASPRIHLINKQRKGWIRYETQHPHYNSPNQTSIKSAYGKNHRNDQKSWKTFHQLLANGTLHAQQQDVHSRQQAQVPPSLRCGSRGSRVDMSGLEVRREGSHFHHRGRGSGRREMCLTDQHES